MTTSKINNKCCRPEDKAQALQSGSLCSPSGMSGPTCTSAPSSECHTPPSLLAPALTGNRLSLVVTAWMLDQQEMFSLWQEEPQVSLCLHQVWPLGESLRAWEACGRAKGSPAAFVPVLPRRLGASGQENQAKCEFPLVSLHGTTTFCTPTVY